MISSTKVPAEALPPKSLEKLVPAHVVVMFLKPLVSNTLKVSIISSIFYILFQKKVHASFITCSGLNNSGHLRKTPFIRPNWLKVSKFSSFFSIIYVKIRSILVV